MTRQAFKLTVPPPVSRGAFVFSSPHSGAEYPRHFLEDSQLDPLTIRSSEDAFVDEIFASATRHGAPMIAARVPRAYVDLNRDETELDPAIVAIPARSGLSPRLAAGLGVIPRVVSEGRVIRSGKISRAEAEARIAESHRPYHLMLGKLLGEARERCGYAVLIDCHSMPRDALRGHIAGDGARPDIVLGDRFGSACGNWLIEGVQTALETAGFRVAHNAPFAGGFITQRYGRPGEGIHALQVEIDRSLYMDERRVVRGRRFDEIRTRIGEAVGEITKLAPGEALPLAAE